MPKPIDRGVSVSWNTPEKELEKLALECMQYLRGSGIAHKLEGCDYVIMIEKGGDAGSMATLPSLQAKGFDETHALALVLGMHLSAIRRFMMSVPGMRPVLLEHLRQMLDA